MLKQTLYHAAPADGLDLYHIISKQVLNGQWARHWWPSSYNTRIHTVTELKIT